MQSLVETADSSLVVEVIYWQSYNYNKMVRSKLNLRSKTLAYQNAGATRRLWALFDLPVYLRSRLAIE